MKEVIVIEIIAIHSNYTHLNEFVRKYYFAFIIFNHLFSLDVKMPLNTKLRFFFIQIYHLYVSS